MKISEPKCSQCRKIAPIDKAMSNGSWKVYKTKEPCECGGKYKISFSEVDGECK